MTNAALRGKPYAGNPHAHNYRTTRGAVLASVCLAVAAYGDTYTWMSSPADNNWNTTSLNWNSGEAWCDGNDAVFNLSSDATITVDGSRAVRDLSIVSSQSPTFSGTGSLAVSGVVSNLSDRASIKVPLVGSNPLRLAGQARYSFTMDANNTYSGGTYVYGLDNGTSGGGTLVLNKGDSSLGAVPAIPTDNIFAYDLGSTFLWQITGSLNAYRRVVIGSGRRFSLGVAGGKTLTVKGEIHGEATGGLDYPTNTHFLVKHLWNGLVKLDPGAGHTNDVGTLDVRGRLTVASGVTRVSIGLDNTKNMGVQYDNARIGNRNGGNALVYVCGGGSWSSHTSAYNSNYGQLTVDGGQIATPEDQWNIQSASDINKYFQAIDYANVIVTNGAIIIPNATYLNGDAVTGCDAPAKLSIRNGGTLDVGIIVVAGSSVASEINLGAGGVLKTRQFAMSSANPGVINLDGGAIYPVPVSGISASDFLGPYWGEGNWANVTVNVMAGGALFTPVEMPAFCNRPLKSGVVAGAADGGLTVRGTREFVLRASGSDYNGPTTVEGGSLMQVRTNNALPGGTTLRVGPGSSVGFCEYGNTKVDLAQTVARVEGCGTLAFNSLLAVTNGVAPVYNGLYGTLTFNKPCSLSGDLEIAGDANGCGCVKFKTAGQSISGLSVKIADGSSFDKDKNGTFYKIVDAPNGYEGQFDVSQLPPGWGVNYKDTAAYLRHEKGVMVIVF